MRLNLKPELKFMKDFKTFAMRGNVVDMAVGIIIGVSFGKIVTSLVEDVIMPPIGVLLGGVDFSKLQIPLGEPKPGADPVAIKYGHFINTIIDFLIVAFVIFLIVKVVNELKKIEQEIIPPPPAPVTTKNCPECLSAIPIKAKRCSQCTSVVSEKA